MEVSIDDFTTRYAGGNSGKIGDSKRNAHSAIHYIDDDLAYNQIATLIYAGSKDCCQLLTSFGVLIKAVRGLLSFYNWRGAIAPPLPKTFEMHRYKEDPIATDTQLKFEMAIKKACNGKRTITYEKDMEHFVVPEAWVKIRQIVEIFDARLHYERWRNEERHGIQYSPSPIDIWLAGWVAWRVWAVVPAYGLGAASQGAAPPAKTIAEIIRRAA